MSRKKVKQTTQTEILYKSRRRCPICYGLNGDTDIKKGQIAHLDQDSSNNDFDNLAFLCFDHHDEFDGKTSQSKSLQKDEVKKYRDDLYQIFEELGTENLPDLEVFEENTNNVERDKLEFDVYQEKIKIYREIRKFLGLIIRDADIEIKDMIEFANKTDEAVFLFDKDISKLIAEIYHQASQLRYTNKRLNSRYLDVGRERTRIAEENMELLNWFSKTTKELKSHFYPYLSL
ncbi:MAG: HNH endonuclease [Balneolaceae bacterium]|nr:HNH endonuclease [Balneolaceae bacterium]